jgi:hypothetical protein
MDHTRTIAAKRRSMALRAERRAIARMYYDGPTNPSAALAAHMVRRDTGARMPLARI